MSSSALDIHIAFPREDIEVAGRLKQLFIAQGWTVSVDLDETFPNTSSSAPWTQAAADSRCLVLIWSHRIGKRPRWDLNQWQQQAAGRLITVFLDSISGESHPDQSRRSFMLDQWSGEPADPRISPLLDAVRALVTASIDAEGAIDGIDAKTSTGEVTPKVITSSWAGAKAGTADDSVTKAETGSGIVPYVWIFAPALLLTVASPWLQVAGHRLVDPGLFVYFATVLTLFVGSVYLVFRYSPWRILGRANRVSTRWRVILAIGVVLLSLLIWSEGSKLGLVSDAGVGAMQKALDSSSQSDYRLIAIGILWSWWVASSWFGLQIARRLLKWTFRLVALLVLLYAFVVISDFVVPRLIDPEVESFNLDAATLAPEMVSIPGGEFLMGSPETESGRQADEGPQHTVRVKAFALGRFEVTCEEYAIFARDRGLSPPDDRVGFWHAGCGRQPVINVSWDDARVYAAWLSEKTGNAYRLPTEAEWEYATRAGTTTSRYWEDDQKSACTQANVFDFLFGCYDGALLKPSPVGQYQANAFGLHDTAGNVWEWVQDCYHDSYKGAPSDGSVWEDKTGCDSSQRVLRGGSWFGNPLRVRSANRGRDGPGNRNSFLGFRLARTL